LGHTFSAVYEFGKDIACINAIQHQAELYRMGQWRKLMKNLGEMRLEEMEEFVLENAILISKTTENGKNIFIYHAEDSYYKVTASRSNKAFERIEPVEGQMLLNYLSNGEKRELFFAISSN
jgi:hypothetical protein